MTDYIVTEVRVTGSFKNWSDPKTNTQGISGGSEIEVSAVPKDPTQVGWTPEEAQVVGFDLRMQIHVMLMADAQIRGVQLPAEAHSAMVSYREKVKTLKLRTSPGYRDAEDPSPSPNLIKDSRVEDPSNPSFPVSST